MSDVIMNNISWIGLGAGIVALFAVLEMLLRGLTTRYGTRQMN